MQLGLMMGIQRKVNLTQRAEMCESVPNQVQHAYTLPNPQGLQNLSDSLLCDLNTLQCVIGSVRTIHRSHEKQSNP
jgi:hypothetical protein